MSEVEEGFKKAMEMLKEDAEKAPTKEEKEVLETISNKLEEIYLETNQLPKMEDILNKIIEEKMDKNINQAVAEIGEAPDGEPIILMKRKDNEMNKVINLDEPIKEVDSEEGVVIDEASQNTHTE